MSDKIITEEILWEKLEEKGIKQPYDTDHEEQLAKVLDHWDASITGDWDDSCNRWFYMESTADSYEVYVATYGKPNDVSICENVYYYENSWLEELPNCIKDGANIFFSELETESYVFIDSINETYEHYFEDKVEEMQDELLDKGWVLQNDVVVNA
jgi:hypothetical protein